MKKISLILLLIVTTTIKAHGTGGVVNGQAVSAGVTNPAFIFKNADDVTTHVLGLNKPAEGTIVNSIQKAINTLWTASGSTETVPGTVYGAPSGTITNGDSYQSALKKLADKFSSSLGHLHTGGAGDGPVLPNTSVSFGAGFDGGLVFPTSTGVLSLDATKLYYDVTALNINPELRIRGTTSGYVGQKVPVSPTSYTITWPSAQGGAGQNLQNDGSGGLSWATPAASGANTTLSNLTSTVAVNVDLLPTGSQAINNGSQAHQWATVWALQYVADLRFISSVFESFPDTSNPAVFQSGNNSTGNSGNVTLVSGDATGATHNSGDVLIDSGTSAAGTRGSVTAKGATLVLNPDATSINMSSHKLSSVTDPTSNQDAATKNYVDTGQSHSARAHNSATTINGTPAKVVWTTEDWDDDGALSSGTFTSPTTANTKYQINASVLVTGTVALNNTIVIGIYRNGTLTGQNTFYVAAGLTDVKATISDINFLALNDTIEIKVSTNITGPSIVSSDTENNFSIAKLP